jgi:hypothetical protein
MALVNGNLHPPEERVSDTDTSIDRRRGRWEGDERGQGIGSGSWIAPDVAQLLDLLTEPDWITEDPDQHLLPHLVAACSEAGAPFRLDGTALRELVYEVSLTWLRDRHPLGQLRADVFALIGRIAETSTFVGQVIGETSIDYQISTGMAADARFAGHGHLVRFQVGGSAIPRLIAGTAQNSERATT